ncbi:hypothetical protein HZS_4906 [Henneguya salminicola]|nr:hypothetical protein HZS_4906 [Henneguya salminicola]
MVAIVLQDVVVQDHDRDLQTDIEIVIDVIGKDDGVIVIEEGPIAEVGPLLKIEIIVLDP